MNQDAMGQYLARREDLRQLRRKWNRLTEREQFNIRWGRVKMDGIETTIFDELTEQHNERWEQ